MVHHKLDSMQFIRNAIRPLLIWYFQFVPVPPSFTKLIKGRSVPAIISQSNSLLIDALLNSFARRSGCYLEPITNAQGTRSG
jgi:hypothetical protein